MFSAVTRMQAKNKTNTRRKTRTGSRGMGPRRNRVFEQRGEHARRHYLRSH